MTRLLRWTAIGALRVDVFVLARMTKLAHAWQRLTGMISFTLARHCWSVTTALAVIELAGYWWRPFGGATDSLPDTIVDAFYVVMCLAACAIAHVAEREWDGATMPSVCAPFMFDPLLRALMTVWLIGLIPLYVGMGAWPGRPTTYATYTFQAAMYLMVVPPLPPAPQRVLMPVNVSA